MAKLERTYNVPLRKEFMKVPAFKKTKKAVKALREFISKHMKSDNVKISKDLNNEMWKHGIKNPPHHVKVTAVKEDETVYVGKEGEKIETKKDKETAEKKEKKAAVPAAKPAEEAKSETKAEEKPESKEDSTNKVKAEENKEAITNVEKPAEEAAEKAEEKTTEATPTSEKQNQN